jgi:phospholipid-binding lipoprotein MlaA
VLGLVVAGCGSLSRAVRHDPGDWVATAEAPAPSPDVNHAVEPPAAAAASVQEEIAAGPDQPTPVTPISEGDLAPEVIVAAEVVAAADAPDELVREPAAALPMVAQAASDASAPAGDVDEQYDPWEPFNEKMFDFNYKLDRYVLKPVARAYRAVMPEPFQLLISNGFDNIRWVPRFINNMLQGKFDGAGREAARFLINSTAGVGGLFDPAKDYWGIRSSKEDFGQTLGVWGAGPGPYLVLPFLPPMTVRDGVGYGVDSFLDPLGYVLPFFWDRLGMKVGDTVNERALNYELFQGVEETTLDLYSSVRHFYLKRREQQIKE